MAECDIFPPEAPDIACEVNNSAFFTDFYIARGDQPIILPAAQGQETEKSRFLRELADRMDEDNTVDPITHVSGLKATMPFSNPAYKNNPISGARVLDTKATAMSIGGIDYRDNDELYNFYKALGAPDDNSQVPTFLLYPKSGRHILYNGRTGDTFYGIKVTFSTSSGVIDSAEVSHQIQYNANWNGNPMPDRFTID